MSKLTATGVEDYAGTVAQYSRIFLWTTPKFYTPYVMATGLVGRKYLEKFAGPFDTAAPAIKA